LLFGQVVIKELVVIVSLSFFAVCAILIIVAFREHLFSVFVVTVKDSKGRDQLEHVLFVSLCVSDVIVSKVEGLQLF